MRIRQIYAKNKNGAKLFRGRTYLQTSATGRGRNLAPRPNRHAGDCTCYNTVGARCVTAPTAVRVAESIRIRKNYRSEKRSPDWEIHQSRFPKLYGDDGLERQHVAGPGGSATETQRDFIEVRQIGNAKERKREGTERDLVAARSTTKRGTARRSAHGATPPLGSTKDKSIRYLHVSYFRGRWWTKSKLVF